MKKKEAIFTFYEVIKCLKNFKRNKYPGIENKSLVILGNGKSLEKDFKNINVEQCDYMVVNGFPTTDMYEVIKPKYCVFLDPDLYVEKVSSSDEFFRRNILKNIIEKTKWSFFLFVPIKGKKYYSEQEIKNSNVKIIYYNINSFSYYNKVSRCLFKLGVAMPSTSNVLVAAIFLAIGMKYSKIYLGGFTHDWIKNIYVDKNNIVYMRDNHFYEKNNYRIVYKNAVTKDAFKLHELLYSFSKTFEAYQILEKYARFNNISIYNATEESYIDAFERMQ